MTRGHNMKLRLILGPSKTRLLIFDQSTHHVELLNVPEFFEDMELIDGFPPPSPQTNERLTSY